MGNRPALALTRATVSLFRCFTLRSNPVDERLDRMQARYNAVKTLAVQFAEQYTVLGHQRPPESGLLTLRKQGKMRWDYQRPVGKLFISDGKDVFLYTSGDNRVEKIPLKDTEDMRAPMAFLLGHLDMKKEFRDFRVDQRADGSWIEAAAKNDRVPYSKIELLLTEDGAVQQLKVVGRDESVLSFQFSHEQLNPEAPDSLFHFAIPPGAEIVQTVDIGSEGK